MEQDNSKTILEQLGDYIFTSKYARYVEDKKRRETWDEAVDRNYFMYLKKFNKLLTSDNVKELENAFDLVRNKRVGVSMRGMQFAGTAVESKNEKLFNCCVRHIDSLRAFAEIQFLLLNGCGVGFGLNKKYMSRLPDLVDASDKTGTVVTYVIEDDVEGWANSIEALLMCYFRNTPYTGKKIIFDYSKIRKKGAPLKTTGGKAPGYQGLKNAHKKIKGLLDYIIEELGVTRLRTVDAYDIIMHGSDAVLSGGIRRAATIAIFEPDDTAMANAKINQIVDLVKSVHPNADGTFDCSFTYKGIKHNLTLSSYDAELLRDKQEISWFHVEPQRARSNNSVLLLRHTVTKEQFKYFFELTKQYGEPGFILASDEDALANPCQPGWAKVLTRNGIRTFNDISIGDEIWSKEGWTKVVNKWGTGVKKVYKYSTNAGIFYGTDKHRVVTNGEKVEVGEAESIDILRLTPSNAHLGPINSLDVMDGLVIGDGSCHKASNNKVYLCIGANDQDYLTSDVGHLILDKSSIGASAYTVATTVTPDEIPKTYLRTIPDRFMYGSMDTVRGFLRGLYSANGSIAGGRVSLKASSKTLIEQVQCMLSSIGIRSYVTTNKSKSVEFRNGEYVCKQSYDLNISTDTPIFASAVGFIQLYKQEQLKELATKVRKPGKENYEIVSVEEVSEEEVFDITVDNESHTYWTQGCNVSNCVEIMFIPVSDNKECGVMFCNLTTINGAKVATKEDFINAAYAAGVIGTCQASFTDFPFLSPVSKKLTDEEALLGVSITGMFDCPEVLLDPDVQREAAKAAVDANRKWAKILGINQAARVTCVKPEGCLTKDTYTITNNGIVSLGEIGDVNGAQWQNLTDTTVINDEGVYAVNKFYINGSAATKRITTSGGLCVEGTYGHKIKVLTKTDGLVWKELQAVEVGDLLPYRVGGYVGPNNYALLKVPKAGDKDASRGIKMPEILDEELAWMLGLYFADGSNHAKGIRISGNAEEKKGFDRLSKILLDRFNISTKLYATQSKAKDKRVQLYANSKTLLNWLELNGLKKGKSLEIEIPLVVRTSKQSVLAAFIDGYSVGDGCDKDRTRSWCTVSKKMAEQLVLSLRGIGVDCKMRNMPPTDTSYGVNMRYWVQERKGRMGDTAKITTNNWFSLLDSVGLYEYSCDSIVEISDSAADTYDLEVDTVHAYLANSYISHNTSSLVFGASSGIHPHHAKRYFRRVQVNKDENVYKHFKKVNDHATEESVWSANKTDDVITFPVEVPSDTAIFKQDLTAIEHLEYIKSTQMNWVATGTTEANKKPLAHSVSCTVIVDTDEWDSVADYLFDNRMYFSAVSLIPKAGDKIYAQAPMEAVITEEDNAKWNQLVENWKQVNYSDMVEKTDYTSLTAEVACAGGACTV